MVYDDGLTEAAIAAVFCIGVPTLATMVGVAVDALTQRWRRHQQVVLLQQELMVAAAAYRPARRATAHCPRCGRFARRVFECPGIEEIFCATHGTEWRIERSVGEFERPVDVVVSTYQPVLDEQVLVAGDGNPVAFREFVVPDYLDEDFDTQPLPFEDHPTIQHVPFRQPAFALGF